MHDCGLDNAALVHHVASNILTQISTETETEVQPEELSKQNQNQKQNIILILVQNKLL